MFLAGIKPFEQHVRSENERLFYNTDFELCLSNDGLQNDASPDSAHEKPNRGMPIYIPPVPNGSPIEIATIPCASPQEPIVLIIPHAYTQLFHHQSYGHTFSIPNEPAKSEVHQIPSHPVMICSIELPHSYYLWCFLQC